MSQLVSDFLLERRKAWGVTRIYGYPGKQKVEEFVPGR